MPGNVFGKQQLREQPFHSHFSWQSEHFSRCRDTRAAVLAGLVGAGEGQQGKAPSNKQRKSAREETSLYNETSEAIFLCRAETGATGDTRLLHQPAPHTPHC